jgi:3-phenylpropionate/trans-cinnamate dioxygenase ferredoxin reductase component
VVTTSGQVLAADLVAVGVGAVPNLELAAEAGLRVDNGVRTDAALRTSASGVFAAGDIACHDHPVLGQPIRTEHWANAFHGGIAAGLSMLGREVSYERLPYFYSDQYDAGLEYIGHVPRGLTAELILRGDPESGSFMAFWLDDGRILAAMQVNQWDSLDPVEPLITNRSPVDANALADVQVPIES